MAQSELIAAWQRKKGQHAAESKEIVKKLQRKKGKRLDELADEAHQAVFSKIDCLDCAGCCSGIPPIVTKGDVGRIAKTFGMKPGDFERQYLTVDEDGDTVMNTTPCPFLMDDKKCMIYDVRPRACRQFPHTDALDFSKNMKLHAMNATICPGVYHILLALEKLV
jgi:Fe-S-cluster containining protein